MNRLILGIDVGKDGALCLLSCDGIVNYLPMPKIGDVTDIHQFVKEIKDVKQLSIDMNMQLTVFVEDVHAIFGSSAASTFEFGGAVKMIHTALIAFDIPFILIKPKEWQAKAWKGIKPQMMVKNGQQKTDTKATSLISAKRLFPTETFFATSRSRAPHNGIVDAVLIAYYGLNFHFNK